MVEEISQTKDCQIDKQKLQLGKCSFGVWRTQADQPRQTKWMTNQLYSMQMRKRKNYKQVTLNLTYCSYEWRPPKVSVCVSVYFIKITLRWQAHQACMQSAAKRLLATNGYDTQHLSSKEVFQLVCKWQCTCTAFDSALKNCCQV